MVMEDMIRDPDHQLKHHYSIQATTSTIASSTWKLYDNPFYHSRHYQYYYSNFNHHLRPPLSTAQNIASCLWDHLTFFPSSIVMDSELDIARAQITELKAELQFERKIRKKVEFLNKKLGRELSEEMKRREAIESVCEKLAEEIALDKAEISRMKREMEEERKMLRMAEVLREERVQMKLTEAKLLFEEKLSEVLKFSKGGGIHIQDEEAILLPVKRDEEDMIRRSLMITHTAAADDVQSTILDSSYDIKSNCSNVNIGGSTVRSTSSKRRASPEAENPHIKRGIKGFVEFPRVVRAISSRGNRQLGSKLECQKSQLRFLLRQKSPVRSNNNLIIG